MRDRIAEIEAKDRRAAIYGAANRTPGSMDFNKMKLGKQMFEDVALEIGSYSALKTACPQYTNKRQIIQAIESGDLNTMREISNFYYKTSGIYNRLVRYMAFMYKYDWFVTPQSLDNKHFSKNTQKVLENFSSSINTLEKFNVKKQLGEIALKVVKNGIYYGYKIETANTVFLQELNPKYCRSTYSVGNRPLVEFNMRFFDEFFPIEEVRLRMLSMFPPEFTTGYRLYKRGKLPPILPGDVGGWYPLDPTSTVKFDVRGEGYPMFISTIPLILDLDEAQTLDKIKTLQRLSNIIIQQMPVDKNGEFIFDPEEAQQLHNNATQMVRGVPNTRVLTTFAETEVAKLSDSSSLSSQGDDLLRVERQLFNDTGVAQNLFNTDGNIALEKSILNDAATMYNLILQFEVFLNDMVSKFNNQPKKVEYRVQILPTTIYNYQELSKLYKEQTQLGYSKMLPQVALGQSQASILSNAYFENEVLDLVNVFIPPMMSSTMNGDTVARLKGTKVDGTPKGGTAPSSSNPFEDKKAGRKEKADDQKSEKTILNKESMN